ncbi:MAG: hypothetical protein H6744_12920 [Deltaproteobacteria bacterium]|nr:hypothetical protein [Deltaproteobacteria bacterium]
MPKQPADRLIIRPLSSVIYFYPTLVAALIAGAVVTANGATPESPGRAGLLFTIVFFFNLTVVAFDYTRVASIVLVLLGVILGLLAALYPGFGGFIEGLTRQPLFMNATFYWVWAGGLVLVLIGVFVKTRFDYWEVRNNELLHHHGFLGDIERWPAPGMRISKEIGDVMEYMLARAGRLVLVPPNERRAIVLDNVPRIDKVEARIQELTNVLRVDEVDTDEEV